MFLGTRQLVSSSARHRAPQVSLLASLLVSVTGTSLCTSLCELYGYRAQHVPKSKSISWTRRRHYVWI